MVTMAHPGFPVECSSAPALGSTVASVTAFTGVAATTDAVDSTDAALVIAAADSAADRLADSTAALRTVAFTEAVDFTVVAGSMVAVDFTVADPTVADRTDTGNSFGLV
jgi:hypothetical protein